MRDANIAKGGSPRRSDVLNYSNLVRTVVTFDFLLPVAALIRNLTCMHAQPGLAPSSKQTLNNLYPHTVEMEGANATDRPLNGISDEVG